MYEVLVVRDAGVVNLACFLSGKGRVGVGVGVVVGVADGGGDV